MDPKVQKSWEDFLNPALLRAHVIIASFYIAGFESLKDAIVDRIRSERVMAIQMLCDIALGDEEKSRLYYDEFQKRMRGA